MIHTWPDTACEDGDRDGLVTGWALMMMGFVLMMMLCGLTSRNSDSDLGKEMKLYPHCGVVGFRFKFIFGVLVEKVDKFEDASA